MKNDEPLTLPTIPPASAKEKAMTRYATGVSEAAQRPHARAIPAATSATIVSTIT